MPDTESVIERCIRPNDRVKDRKTAEELRKPISAMNNFNYSSHLTQSKLSSPDCPLTVEFSEAGSTTMVGSLNFVPRVMNMLWAMFDVTRKSET